MAGWSADRPEWQVRIRLKPDEPPVGAGMLCNDSYIVTCAHVVDPRESKPTGPVFVEFQFANRHDPIPAVVVDGGWHPESQNGSGDVAVLKLQGPLPPEAQKAPLSDSKRVTDHTFRAYGYPRGHESDGVWSRGSIVGSAKVEWLQLEANSNLGHSLQEGFSGAPIWDDRLDRVVGIVVTRDKDKDTRTGFGIPVAVIRQYWPGLERSKPSKPAQQRWEEQWPGLAPPRERVAARTIDFFAVAVVATTTWVLAGWLGMPQRTAIALGAALGLGYEPLVMLLWRTTLGKRRLDIEPVAARTGEPLGIAQAVKRALMVDLLLYLLTPLLLVNLFRLWRDPARQCVHDAAAGTLVLRNYRTSVRLQRGNPEQPRSGQPVA